MKQDHGQKLQFQQGKLLGQVHDGIDKTIYVSLIHIHPLQVMALWENGIQSYEDNWVSCKQ
jgi:hypothetical protein